MSIGVSAQENAVVGNHDHSRSCTDFIMSSVILVSGSCMILGRRRGFPKGSPAQHKNNTGATPISVQHFIYLLRQVCSSYTCQVSYTLNHELNTRYRRGISQLYSGPWVKDGVEMELALPHGVQFMRCEGFAHSTLRAGRVCSKGSLMIHDETGPFRATFPACSQS